MLVYKVQEQESSEPSRPSVEVPSESLEKKNHKYNNKDSGRLKIVLSHCVEHTAFLQRLVDQDNQKFEEWCSEMADMRKQSVDKGKAKHEEVKELYELLPAKDGR